MPSSTGSGFFVEGGFRAGRTVFIMDSNLDMTLFVKRYKEIEQRIEKGRLRKVEILEKAKTMCSLEEFAKLVGMTVEDLEDIDYV